MSERTVTMPSAVAEGMVFAGVMGCFMTLFITHMSITVAIITLTMSAVLIAAPLPFIVLRRLR